MTSSTDVLSPAETSERLGASAFVHLRGSLYGSYGTADFASATRLVAQVAEAADAMNHHPDIRLGYGSVVFQLSSHDAGGVTERDLRLAEQIQALADSLGAVSAAVRPARYEVAIDCANADDIRDFWKVGLGYDERPGETGEIELVDPRGYGPTLWFQTMESARTDRNRVHLDVYLPTVDAESRVRAIVEAGGFLLTAEHAPDWWVLADVEGNELCVCTSAT